MSLPLLKSNDPKLPTIIRYINGIIDDTLTKISSADVDAAVHAIRTILYETLSDQQKMMYIIETDDNRLSKQMIQNLVKFVNNMVTLCEDYSKANAEQRHYYDYELGIQESLETIHKVTKILDMRDHVHRFYGYICIDALKRIGHKGLYSVSVDELFRHYNKSPLGNMFPRFKLQNPDGRCSYNILFVMLSSFILLKIATEIEIEQYIQKFTRNTTDHVPTHVQQASKTFMKIFHDVHRSRLRAYDMYFQDIARKMRHEDVIQVRNSKSITTCLLDDQLDMTLGTLELSESIPSYFNVTDEIKYILKRAGSPVFSPNIDGKHVVRAHVTSNTFVVDPSMMKRIQYPVGFIVIRKNESAHVSTFYLHKDLGTLVIDDHYDIEIPINIYLQLLMGQKDLSYVEMYGFKPKDHSARIENGLDKTHIIEEKARLERLQRSNKTVSTSTTDANNFASFIEHNSQLRNNTYVWDEEDDMSNGWNDEEDEVSTVDTYHIDKKRRMNRGSHRSGSVREHLERLNHCLKRIQSQIYLG